MNCPCPQFDLQKYKGKPYQETPCASCFMTRETNKTGKHSQLFDTDGAQDKTADIVKQQTYNPQIDQIQKMSPEAVKLIQEACQQNFLVVLSNIVLKLTDLSKSYPILYQILHMKMQHPQLSYYQIGRKIDPPCSKQNVLYHLSHAVRQFPDLAKAIITDTRFSAGKNAIKSVADKAARHKQIERVRRKIYDCNDLCARKEFKELQEEFDKPCKVSTIQDFED